MSSRVAAAPGCPGFSVPGIWSLILLPFPNADSLLGPENGPDFGTAFLIDLAGFPRGTRETGGRATDTDDEHGAYRNL